MMHRPASWIALNAIIISAITGCDDLRLAERLDNATSQGGVTTSTNAGGTSQGGGQGGNTVALVGGAGQSTLVGAGGVVVEASGGAGTGLASGLGATVATGGVAATLGGATTTLGGTAATGGAATGGTATGGVAAGGAATGGVAAGGAEAGGASTGGAVTGGTTTGGVATGGAATGGTVTSGTPTGGTSTGGAATGGTILSVTGGTSSDCPFPATKNAALLAVEPTPADSCARVSNVIPFREDYLAFGFTNGEIYTYDLSNATKPMRVDIWVSGGYPYGLPTAVVTSMVAPRYNIDGSMCVGYADQRGTSYSPWWARRAGAFWYESTIENPGTVMTITVCPFHFGIEHLEVATPWRTEGSVTSGESFDAANAGKLNLHLQLANTCSVTAIETVNIPDETVPNGWLVYAGTECGEILVSSRLIGTVTWSDMTNTLGASVAWTRITGAQMPKKWITRLAVHPTYQNRIFAVFASEDGDAVWYSEDAGTTWSNRHANLPTKSDPINNAPPPVLGVSFNPLLDNAAYAITPHTSYYTLNYGISWAEY